MHHSGASSSSVSLPSPPEPLALDKRRRTSSALVKVVSTGLLVFSLFGLYRLAAMERHVDGEGHEEVSLEEVFWSAWTTCASTALGALPFFFFTAIPSSFTLGVSNACAAGMMLAASVSLAWEGWVAGRPGGDSGAAAGGGSVFLGDGGGGSTLASDALHLATIIGGGLGGVGAILASKPLLGAWGGAESVFEGLETANARKALLLCLVMFAHSMTEGVGIGVSFMAGDPHTHAHAQPSLLPPATATAPSAPPTTSVWSLGRFVSLSLAIHNIPEGLATCLTLVPRGIPPLEAALWALLTSLSQPIFAVLAVVFVHTFGKLLAPGLGFAAGAMTWVACNELLPEAHEQLQGGRVVLAGITAAAAAAMFLMQAALR
jgi:ZIP family zinc transporter